MWPCPAARVARPGARVAVPHTEQPFEGRAACGGWLPRLRWKHPGSESRRSAVAGTAAASPIQTSAKEIGQHPSRRSLSSAAAGPKPPPQQPRGQGSAQQGANDRSLQIPPDAAKTGNTGFVGGEWRSDKGLIDQVTKQPLQQAYRFDPKGDGEVVIRRPDGVECRAAAQARMQGGQLSINELGDPRCPDGRTFRRSTTECMRTPSGQTVCQGRNADGSTYRVGIERQQEKP